MDRFGDASLADRSRDSSSSQDARPDPSSFTEERAARLAQRARAAAAASLAASDEADEEMLEEDSMISASSPTWPMATSHRQLQQQPQQSQQPASVLWSRDYPSLFAPLHEDTSSLGGGGANVSIAESLRSPGQFGSPADWSQQQSQQQQQLQLQQNPLQPTPFIDLSRYTFEFPAHPPPMSFPVTAALAARAAMERQRPQLQLQNRQQLQPRPLPCLMQMQPGMIYGHGQPTSEGFASRRMQFVAAAHEARAHMLTLPPFLRTQWQREQNEPPARRARPTSNNYSRRHSTSDSSADSSRGSSGGQIVDCSYCRSVHKDPSGHNKHNCPRLMELPPCRICGASGKMNHTESHCPDMEKTELAFIPPTFRRRTHTI